MIDELLEPYRENLGPHYPTYRNHAHRVYEYARIFCLQNESIKLQLCAAFHDLAIWTGNSMDYLHDSAEIARAYTETNQPYIVSDEIVFIIKNHHRLRRIKGHLEGESFRKADLIDLSAGLIHFNIPPSLIRETESKFPRLGFTKLILNLTFHWALRHPYRPFPMIRI
ncbi:MAG: HD domain-containing protein [Cyclobacteriaceae bacterium]|nr:HD domain-containing protein [Cyclobacteriaceae bacterium]